MSKALRAMPVFHSGQDAKVNKQNFRTWKLEFTAYATSQDTKLKDLIEKALAPGADSNPPYQDTNNDAVERDQKLYNHVINAISASDIRLILLPHYQVNGLGYKALRVLALMYQIEYDAHQLLDQLTILRHHRGSHPKEYVLEMLTIQQDLSKHQSSIKLSGESDETHI